MRAPVEEYCDPHVMGVDKGAENHQVPPLMTGANVVHLTWRTMEGTSNAERVY